MSGNRVGRIMLTGCGRGESTGREEIEVVRCARDSLRWVSDFEDSRERWWENCEEDDGAVVEIDCWLTTIALFYSQILCPIQLSSLLR